MFRDASAQNLRCETAVCRYRCWLRRFTNRRGASGDHTGLDRSDADISSHGACDGCRSAYRPFDTERGNAARGARDCDALASCWVAYDANHP